MIGFNGLTTLITLFSNVRIATAIPHEDHLNLPLPNWLVSSNSVDDERHAWQTANHQSVVNRFLPDLPKNAEPAFVPYNPNEASWGLHNLGLYI